MLLNLKQIGVGSPYDEKKLDFAHGLDLSAVRLWGEYPFKTPVKISGTASCRSGIYTIGYTADFSMEGQCARCLVPVVRGYAREFQHTILDGPDDGEKDDSFVIAPGLELDLDELVISDILLEFSGVTLCKEDCRGICPKCGKNLNEGDCGCILKEPDPRFDALRKLLQENE